jgi:hypothetical protein
MIVGREKRLKLIENKAEHTIENTDMGIRIVVLDRVFDYWMDPKIREFFGDVLALRFEGYGQEYPRHVIPADNSDYFATHIVTCEEYSDGKLIPISSYKMVSMKRCQEFKREFVGMQVPKEAGARDHLDAVASIMASCEEKKIDLGYCCSWTIRPRIRKNEILTKLIRNMVYSSHSNWQKEAQVPEMVIAGVQKFKADIYQESIGYKKFQINGRVLDTFGHTDLAQEQVFMLHMTEFSEYCKSMAARYQSYWDDRLVLGGQSNSAVQKENESSQKAA